MATGFEGTKTVRANGVDLAYVEHGSGEPVVFVHGAISDLRTWDQQLPVIGSQYRAIAYSRRFARPNADLAPGTDDPWGRHVHDLAAFLREVGAAPAHLVGNSQGAFISLLTGLHHPAVVRSLVLEEPAAISIWGVGVPPKLSELVRLALSQPQAAMALVRSALSMQMPMQRAFKRGDDEEAIEIFSRGVLGDEAYQNLSAARLRQIEENMSTLKALALRADLPPLSEGPVRHMPIPTLLINGSESPDLLVRLLGRLEFLLPNVEHVEVQGASHFMHEDDPATVNQVILDFLKRQNIDAEQEAA